VTYPVVVVVMVVAAASLQKGKTKRMQSEVAIAPKRIATAVVINDSFVSSVLTYSTAMENQSQMKRSVNSKESSKIRQKSSTTRDKLLKRYVDSIM